MTALLHRFLAGHPHHRHIMVPAPLTRRAPLTRGAPATRQVVRGGAQTALAAAAERLVTIGELDRLRSLHPRRMTVGH